jgi:phosphoglycerate kinase
MLARKLRLEHIASTLRDKRVLMRVDFNVPLKEGKVSDATRIASTLPSLKMSLDNYPKSLVLLSHLGRPDGNPNPKYSLRPVASELERLLQRPVTFLPHCVGEEVKKALANPPHGSIFLLENLRFHAEEEGKGVDASGKKFKPPKEAVEDFRAQLTSYGDVFINDAFGTAHRAHSSMVGINLPVRAAGLLMGKELEYFSKALEDPKRPLLVILGGAKVKDKIQLIKNLLNISNEMIIGGGMAFTFKKVLDKVNIGKSLYDEEGAKIVHEIMEVAKHKNVRIYLPDDYLCSDRLEAGGQVELHEGSIPDGLYGLDIGPKSIEKFASVIRKANTVVWNGPPGVFENPAFRQGSTSFFNEILEGTKSRGLLSIVGGGDTAAFVQSQGERADQISHISTGGGASLELMEGKELPGIAYLSDKS